MPDRRGLPDRVKPRHSTGGDRDLRGAVRAASCLDRDRHRALRALARGRRRWGRALEPVRLAHDEKDGEGHEDEVDDRVDEHAVVQRGRAVRLGRGQRRIGPPREADEEIAEVDAAECEAERRHQQVVHERGHDGAEGHAEDDRHREVDDVATHEERLELAEHAGLLYLLESRKRPSARCGRPERSNVSTASAGEPTSGSPWRLKEVFSTAPMPVRPSNSRITRWYPGFHASSTTCARAVKSCGCTAATISSRRFGLVGNASIMYGEARPFGLTR